jgi:hypothetical protein
MIRPIKQVERFCRLDFHDDTLVDIRILPSRKRGPQSQSAIEIHLYRSWEGKLHRVLTFTDCKNVRLALDFDVLADNLDPNTSSVSAHADVDKIRDLIMAQEVEWDVNYEHGSRSPLPEKLQSLGKLVLFRVQFFGGAIDVIASRYQVKRNSKKPETVVE